MDRRGRVSQRIMQANPKSAIRDFLSKTIATHPPIIWNALCSEKKRRQRTYEMLPNTHGSQQQPTNFTSFSLHFMDQRGFSERCVDLHVENQLCTRQNGHRDKFRLPSVSRPRSIIRQLRKSPDFWSCLIIDLGRETDGKRNLSRCPFCFVHN